MTRPSASDAAATADPEVAPRVSGAGRPSPLPHAVEMSTDLLDAIVDELFAVGLALRSGARSECDQHRTSTEQLLDGLDGVIALIRRSALAGMPPPCPRIGIPGAADAGSRLQQPELVALSSLPNGELSTIELIDAAHSARRAVMALQNITGPGERRPAGAANTGAATSPGAQLAPSTRTGRPTLADVSASGEQ